MASEWEEKLRVEVEARIRELFLDARAIHELQVYGYRESIGAAALGEAIYTYLRQAACAARAEAEYGADNK